MVSAATGTVTACCKLTPTEVPLCPVEGQALQLARCPLSLVIADPQTHLLLLRFGSPVMFTVRQQREFPSIDGVELGQAYLVVWPIGQFLDVIEERKVRRSFVRLRTRIRPVHHSNGICLHAMNPSLTYSAANLDN